MYIVLRLPLVLNYLNSPNKKKFYKNDIKGNIEAWLRISLLWPFFPILYNLLLSHTLRNTFFSFLRHENLASELETR